MSKRVLVVLTSCDKIESNGQQTGWYLPELAHPYKVLTDAGLTDIDVISPKGGKSPLDQGSFDQFKDDEVCKAFLKDEKAQNLVNNTKTPAQVKASDYGLVFYPGGHGPMFDLANDKVIAKITSEIYENGGVVGAVCHGPAGLFPVRLSNEDHLLKGRKVTAFTNDEEEACQLTQHMPFALETSLGESGATFSKADIFQCNVVVDGRLVTGQNPASSTAMAEAMVKLIK